jgi:hypothetical protein
MIREPLPRDLKKAIERREAEPERPLLFLPVHRQAIFEGLAAASRQKSARGIFCSEQCSVR